MSTELRPTAPRIPPLPPEEWGDDVRAGLAALRPAGATQELRRSKGGPKGLNVLGTLAQHPALMQAYHTFNGHILYTNTLDARQRELLVLRVAGAVAAPSTSGASTWSSPRDLGFTDADIERVAEGPHADGWSPLDAAMLARRRRVRGRRARSPKARGPSWPPSSIGSSSWTSCSPSVRTTSWRWRSSRSGSRSTPISRPS